MQHDSLNLSFAHGFSYFFNLFLASLFKLILMSLANIKFVCANNLVKILSSIDILSISCEMNAINFLSVDPFRVFDEIYLIAEVDGHCL